LPTSDILLLFAATLPLCSAVVLVGSRSVLPLRAAIAALYFAFSRFLSASPSASLPPAPVP
jgi:hypothetical protein